jgi:hypothetical protein
MRSVVVYESLWGNTATVARSIAEGLGDGAIAVSTGDATPDVVAGADLIVAGAPLLGFRLPTESMREGTRRERVPPDLSSPAMRTWLAGMHEGSGRAAAFETRFRWSPGSATGAIEEGLRAKGYRPLAKPARFIVKGRYGPLRDGELDRARAWGAELARVMREGAGTAG